MIIDKINKHKQRNYSSINPIGLNIGNFRSYFFAKNLENLILMVPKILELTLKKQKSL
jgi:hypothetical protein